MSGCLDVPGLVEQGAPPGLGAAVVLRHEEADRAADVGGQLAHPLDVALDAVQVFAGDAGGDHLEQSHTEVPEDLADTEQLIPRRVGAGDRLAVGGVVEDRPRGGEAEGSGAKRLGDDGRHGFDVGGIGGIVAGPSFAHHIRPHRGMRNLGPDVHDMAAAAQGVEVLGKGLPAPVHPGP